MKNVIVLIPTKRPPPLDTLTHFTFPSWLPTVLVADPSVYRAHLRWLETHGRRNISVVLGRPGLVPQIRFCYRLARRMHAKWFFRLDDDCPKDFFVLKDRSTPSLVSVIRWALDCAAVHQVTLVGFANSSRVDWLGDGSSRSYGLIHGGAQLVRAMDPDRVLPEEIVCYEDIYRSCAHRKLDGAVGRVNFVGLNKTGGMKDTMNAEGKAKWKRGQQQLLRDFPGFGTFFGKATAEGIPRFRHRPHPGYSKLPHSSR